MSSRGLAITLVGLPFLLAFVGYMSDPSTLSMFVADLIGSALGSLIDPINLLIAFTLGYWRASFTRWIIVCITLSIVYSSLLQYLLSIVDHAVGAHVGSRTGLVIYRAIAIL